MKTKIYTLDETSPFYLDQDKVYQDWRQDKLKAYPIDPKDLVIELKDPLSLRPSELRAITDRCERYNMVIYSSQWSHVDDRRFLGVLGEQLGLEHLDDHRFTGQDNISAIKICSDGRIQDFIPYTDRSINWHTDGYYNSLDRQIRGMILHCVSPSATGGENALMDHEILYILMRDENPDYVRALMDLEAMTLPAIIEDGLVIRDERKGPVFSIDPVTGALHMRYTARTRSIKWKEDPVIQSAVQYLESLLNSDLPYMIKHRMEAGQGVICNNTLHKRKAFKNSSESERLMYRARYYNRITN
ncbi:MAG TPA: taurine catabolism dioxygenase TauD [Spirochaetes bacterium]|nr:taurine catabolism dioxygenase TauD [Spirochaetota bacterium]